MRREVITTDKIAPPVGPFAAGVRESGLIFLSGQIALAPSTGKLIEGDVTQQATQVLKNIEAVLNAAGRTFADVVKATVFLLDMKDFGAVNKAYEARFEAPYPARTAVAVAALPLGALVEIEVIAR